jgi:hypothetical protein
MLWFHQPICMTIVAPAEQESSYSLTDDRAADQLVCKLRTSRLTVLCGGAATRISQFVATDVAPRLARRRWDRSLTRARQDLFTLALQGQRTSRRRSAESAELPVLIDRWVGHATATLQARINDSFESAGAYMTSIALPIAESLSAWSQLLDLRFLIIFDRFDEFLAERAESDDGRTFTRELVEILGTPGLAVNLLFCVSANFESQMQQYQAELAGLAEAARVRLPLRASPVSPSVSDLTLIQWPQSPSAKEQAASDGDSRTSGNRPVRATGGLRAACAATITAIGVFCWPTLPQDVRVDAAGYLASAAQVLEQRFSELVHRLELSLDHSSASADGSSHSR